MMLFSGRKARQWMAISAGIFLLSAALGCATVQPARTPTEMPSEPEPRVTLGPGDVLDLKFFHVPELNESQMVRPDGKIALQLVGEVNVQGKTPADLRDDLIRLYTPELKRADVTVIIRSLANRRVYVGGDVLRPGLVDMPRQMTALEAIMQSGGFDIRRAEISNVVIIRHKDGKRYGCALDLTEALKGKEVQLFYLEPQDIVYVPRNKISQVANWIDQHINQMIPRVGFGWSKFIGDGQTIAITPPTTVVTQP